MSRHYHQLPFSPAAEFVVERPMTIYGQALDRGDRLPKEKLGERRLRQLYEQRMIAPSPFEAPPPAFLNNGRGKADQLAAELAKEEAPAILAYLEGESDGEAARVPAAPRRADAAKSAAAAQPAPAKGVARKPAPRRSAKPAAAPARGVSV